MMKVMFAAGKYLIINYKLYWAVTKVANWG